MSRSFFFPAGSGDPTRADSYTSIRSVLRGYGKWIQVYVDERDVGIVAPDTVQDLVTTFEQRILPTSAHLWGVAEDIDGDGRLTVLMSSMLERLGNGHSVDGLFRGVDLASRFAPPFGNRCDMLYLNAKLAAGPHLRTVLAHEYAHAVTFTHKCLAPDRLDALADEESWLDEAIAHLVEDVHGFSRSNLDHRVHAYLEAPEKYGLVVRDYYRADLFRSHGHRGSTYLFLRWCADRFGPGLLAALIASDSRGKANLEAATGASFEDLFRHWAIALGRDSIRLGTPPGEDHRPVGLRMVELSPGDPEERWIAAGTSLHYVVIEGSSEGGIEVEVEGPNEARLQVTAIKGPAGLSFVHEDETARRSLPSHE